MLLTFEYIYGAMVRGPESILIYRRTIFGRDYALPVVYIVDSTVKSKFIKLGLVFFELSLFRCWVLNSTEIYPTILRRNFECSFLVQSS